MCAEASVVYLNIYIPFFLIRLCSGLFSKLLRFLLKFKINRTCSCLLRLGLMSSLDLSLYQAHHAKIKKIGTRCVHAPWYKLIRWSLRKGVRVDNPHYNTPMQRDPA